MIRAIVLFIVLIFSLYSTTLSELRSMPKCREKDFFIWQFIKDPKTSVKEAREAIKMAYSINSTLRKAYKKKTGYYPPRRKRKRSEYAKREAAKYKRLINKLYKSGNFYGEWLKLPAKDKLKVFNYLGKDRRILNRDIPRDVYIDLTKYYGINSLIYRAFKENLYILKRVILTTLPANNNKISYKNLMKIGFKDIQTHKSYIASHYFKDAIRKANDKINLDRALFWTYLTTKDEKYLNRVANSYDFNIYKLTALDFLGRPYNIPYTPKIDSDKKINFDITDPIEWARLKKKIFSKNYNLYRLAEEYKTKETYAHYLYILTRASNYKKQFFPIIYEDLMRDYSTDRKALMLAIARQESKFIPASISSSFALGMMQFMPFLVRHIAKQEKMKVQLEDMFRPEISVRFANRHLNYLNKYLYHPLFVAYAYNAGIGYTRKMLRKSNLFRSGEYEPYLSLELIDKAETNIYGKKVLANYVIYKNLMNEPIKMTTLLNQLDEPLLTDRFRK